MIPEKTLQEIQERLDIVEVIGGYLSLKKAGRNFKALCPFHPEKTPSFMVYPHKQFFICYGCGAGGDLISFVIRHEQIDFTEAVETLAQKVGISVTTVRGYSKSAHPELYQAHALAAGFYHQFLLQDPQGERAKAYLKKRGVSEKTWDLLQIGYAPDRWDLFLNTAGQQGLSPQTLERAGLAIPKEGGSGWYDRFRARVIFPIWDTRGRVIAFGGRVLEDSEGPKYMNSPETELYVKGRLLYGLHLATTHIREKDFCIVVEGYMDLISPYQNGIRNIVASMGTSLTETQVKLIRRHTKHVVIVYDADYAGEMATLRGLDLFLEAEMRVKVAALPAGTDPDSLIRSRGIEAFAQAVRESQDLFDYKLGLLRRQFDPKDLNGRIQISEEMLQTIKRVPNAIQRGEYIHRLSELLGVAETLLWAELNRVKHKAPSSHRPTELKEPLPGTPAEGISAEGLLVGLLLEEPRLAESIAERLNLENLQDLEVRQLVHWLIERAQDGKASSDQRTLLSRLPRGSEHWEARIARWLAWADSIVEKDQALDEILERIEHSRHQVKREGLLDSIRDAEKTGDDQTTSRLIVEYNRLMKEHTARALKQ